MKFGGLCVEYNNIWIWCLVVLKFAAYSSRFFLSYKVFVWTLNCKYFIYYRLFFNIEYYFGRRLNNTCNLDHSYYIVVTIWFVNLARALVTVMLYIIFLEPVGAFLVWIKFYYAHRIFGLLCTLYLVHNNLVILA